MAIASLILASLSCVVCPVAMQPGRSGEYAETPVSVGSMRIRNRCMRLLRLRVRQASLPQHTLHCANGDVVVAMAGYGHSARFDGMLELVMTSPGLRKVPAVLVEQA